MRALALLALLAADGGTTIVVLNNYRWENLEPRFWESEFFCSNGATPRVSSGRSRDSLRLTCDARDAGR